MDTTDLATLEAAPGGGLSLDVRTLTQLNGPLTVRNALTVEGPLNADGDISLPNNATLNARGRLHIAGDEHLYLLNKTGVTVSAAWGGNGALTVEGPLNARGVVTLPNNGTLTATGRLHIAGDEHLFLLNKTGVTVSAAWGGNGALTVEGPLNARGVVTLPNNGTLTATGRLHIAGDEHLFLLNKTGVTIGRGWGGNGQLTVDGDMRVWGRNLAVNDSPGVAGWSGGGIVAWDIFARGGVYVGVDPEHPRAKIWSDGRKSFVIDHPLAPDSRLLTHVCLEGPEAGVYYRGEAALTDGLALVELPPYFEALTRTTSRTILLTPIAEVDEAVSPLAATPITEGRFLVHAADERNLAQRFCWEVKAERADIDHVEVETDKVVTSGRSL